MKLAPSLVPHLRKHVGYVIPCGVFALFHPTGLALNFLVPKSLIVLKTVLHGTALKALGRGHGKRAHETQVQLTNNVTVNMQEMPKNESAKKK